ncbi:MAG: hypothetical protein JKY96_02800 [Phycisphaerales bacterium]|nr:hypothetical protein [Phycisphaerales bacterium]
MIAKGLNLLGGFSQMLRMGLVSRFRLRGAYWQWRTQTAFPQTGSPEGFANRFGLMVEYFMWVSRIRRLR